VSEPEVASGFDFISHESNIQVQTTLHGPKF